MAGFFQFLPAVQLGDLVERKKLQRDVLAQYGLSDVLRDCTDAPDHVVVTEVAAGPSGTAGLCLYPKSPIADSPPGWSYRPEHQTWQPTLDGRRWLGWETAAPPTPVDLARRSVYSDYLMRDKLGQEWFVPCARTADTSRSTLPVEYGFSAVGLVCRTAPDFAHLWDLSGEVLDYLRGRVERDELWQVSTALAVIQVNYRVGRDEVTALQTMGRALLTRLTVQAVLQSLVDNDLEQEVLEQKKTSTEESPSESSVAAPSSACSGIEVDSPVTARLAEP